MKRDSVLIFDVGRTNKKLVLFDEQYNVLHEDSIRLPEITDEDGYACEDIETLTNWVKRSFELIASDPRFEIKAVNFSAYGASIVYVDDQLKPLLPLYNYLKPYPENLQQNFYNNYGGKGEFSSATASPVLGSLNSGMQIYRLKHERPETFTKIRWALHLPQYLATILHKKAYSEITSIGCHTNLWDFRSGSYHDWVSSESIKEKLPPIIASDFCVECKHNGKSISVGPGLHDSSAALIPYLKCFRGPFAMISTGTWCITLNPFNYKQLTPEDLQRDCLSYLSFKGEPVKASRLFAGHEHEVQANALASRYKTSFEKLVQVEFDASLLPSASSGLTMDDQRKIEPAERAYHELMIDIVAKQLISTKYIVQDTNVRQLFVDGGFARNSIYMNLLAAVFPDHDVFAASVPCASALGAALAIHSCWNKREIPTGLISLKKYVNATKGLET